MMREEMPETMVIDGITFKLVYKSPSEKDLSEFRFKEGRDNVLKMFQPGGYGFYYIYAARKDVVEKERKRRAMEDFKKWKDQKAAKKRRK